MTDLSKFHPVSEKIVDFLEKNHCWFEIFEHEPVRTSEEAAKVRPGYSLHQGAKALIIKAKKESRKEEFVMLVFPADLRFDNKKVKELLQTDDICFATKDEVCSITAGVELGGVPPFGNLFGLKVIADQKLFENEKIIFNAGDRRFSVAMKSSEFQKIVDPVMAKIT